MSAPVPSIARVLSAARLLNSLLGLMLGGIPGALLSGLNVSHPLNQHLEVSSEDL